MPERTSATSVLGLEFFGRGLRAVLLSHGRNGVQCDRSFILENQAHGEGMAFLRMSEDGRALVRAMSDALPVVGIEGAHTIIRQMEVKLKRASDVDAVLAFQAEPLLPFPTEEMQLDREIVEQTAEGILLALLAVRRDHLHDLLERWKLFHVDPEVVGAIPHALATCAKFALAGEGPFLILHIGCDAVECVLIHHGHLLGAQSFKGGVADLQAAYQRDTNSDISYSDPDFIALDAKQFPATDQYLGQIKREVVRAALGLAKYAHLTQISGIAVCGEGSLYTSLSRALSSAIRCPLVSFNPPQSLNLDTASFTRLALPIGLALTALPDGDVNQINFRYGEMAYPRPWRRLMQPIALSLMLCGALACSTFFLGKSYLAWREAELRASYIDLVAELKRDYGKMEQQFGEIITPEQQNVATLDTRINALEREINSAPETMALFPNTPRVSDLLVWLSNHPQLATGNQDAPIQISSFNYRMVKRPELNKMRDHYQVQVEIDFSSRSPRAARLFYESLITPNAMVDPKNEVKWTASGDRFRIAFFLKDRTAYPNS